MNVRRDRVAGLIQSAWRVTSAAGTTFVGKGKVRRDHVIGFHPTVSHVAQN